MKMKKTTSILAIAGVVLALALAPVAQAAPNVVPTDGYTGPYRILFCTVTSYSAVATDITVYNARIEAEAAATAWAGKGVRQAKGSVLEIEHFAQAPMRPPQLRILPHSGSNRGTDPIEGQVTRSNHALVTYRSATPIGSALRQFMRLKITTR